MMVATVLSGFFMFAVNAFASKELPKHEYGVLGAFLQVLNWIMIPALGLQTVFAQQTAGALSDEKRRQLSSTARGVFAGTFVIWGVIMAVLLIWEREIVKDLKITNPAGLWATALTGLAFLWLQEMLGVLQGQQNFLWLGWSQIFNGVGRFAAAVVIVVGLAGYAAGVMTAAFLGMTTALAVAAWKSRGVWSGCGAPFGWGDWLRRVVPLTLGLGASQFMFSADMIVVQSHYLDTAAYVAAGTLGRALVTFTAPLAVVMFPRVVRSTALAQKTNVLALTLAGTAVLGGCGALGLMLTSHLVLRYVFRPEFVKIAPLVAWFGWCMLPLALANVLISQLLASARYVAVPWLILVAAAYWVALAFFHATFLMVVQTLGVFNLVLLAVAAWFTWRSPPHPIRANGLAP
jgi:O-antigen/teichoic acid export membrane protein